MDGWTDEWMDGWMSGGVCVGGDSGDKQEKKKHQTAVTRPHECHFFLHLCVSLSLLFLSASSKCVVIARECVCMQNKLPVSMTDSPVQALFVC